MKKVRKTSAYRRVKKRLNRFSWSVQAKEQGYAIPDQHSCDYRFTERS
jgi:hypothetical protein